MSRLLKTKPLQPNPFESFSKSTSDDSDDTDSPFTKTEFVVYDNTVIKFGKLKGKMHSDASGSFRAKQQWKLQIQSIL